MIATNEAVDVLRHGWQDAASTLSADIPEVAELLQARLEMAISTERLDERNLLDTIQEVESLTSRAGSPSSQALARRLRRTVYEYLLALDAARPSETNRARVDQPATAADSPLVGAEEVAAMGHVPAVGAGETDEVEPIAATAGAIESQVDPAAVPTAGLDDQVDADGVAQEPDATSARRRFALRRRPRQGTDPAGGPDAAALEPVAPGDSGAPETDDDGSTDGQPPPDWKYTPAAEPAVFQSDTDAAASDPLAGGVAPDPSASLPAGDQEGRASEGEAATPMQDADSPHNAGFVAPRAGFHIVEDAPAHRISPPDEARLEMPAFSADGPESGPDQASPFLAWRPAGGVDAVAPESASPLGSGMAPSPTDAAAAGDGGVPEYPAPASGDATGPAASAEPADSDDGDAEQRGWGVRRPGEAHSGRRGNAAARAPIDDDPFENNSRLADIRRRIEDRLRKKRCDEAAALLQELAQEAGGRAVAELAMNAGDRCRALGKSNAALNCYLAAARSDPVYELPLSRLADICIDNQDTELAVSYLERIARLYRYRGDDKAAIRIYRRIATVAPYRDDVLALLTNAQRTGRLE